MSVQMWLIIRRTEMAAKEYRLSRKILFRGVRNVINYGIFVAVRKFKQRYVVTYFETTKHLFTNYIMTTIESRRTMTFCLFNYQSRTTSYLQTFF